MLYINQARRETLDKPIHALSVRLVVPGDLNYALTRLLHKHLVWQGRLNYDKLNEVMGVLASVSQEFYRRVVAPYEDEKIKEHGDIDATSQ